MRQSSESLAEVASLTLKLTGLTPLETNAVTPSALNQLWLRGDFQNSYTAISDHVSATWRENFIQTYLERDIPQFGLRHSFSVTLRRFLTMLAHFQATTVNISKLATNLDLSSTTIKRYLDLLVDLLLVHLLEPWYANNGKQLIKWPKIYIRDSGLLHQLLNIPDFDALLAHPVVGAGWEGFLVENLSHGPRSYRDFFLSNCWGAEIDVLPHMPGQECLGH
ncbi:DUF4143 domain-containing protein [Coxiella endosymbiont of Ornithodoros amblus]|uniref:DUF4143 domain-containing protein n=1 Tax=Coxiella endosymbiont of Ornithodoros amblus TaxID=1656166 RepID=UPI00244DBF11|nr:DUF4143 domain-containing protein [Coxiella endosymbiont of Ornithodoros amblus]